VNDLPARLRGLLWQHTTLVTATERGGAPWIASVFYAPSFDDGRLTLTCTLLASSRKLANLRLNPRVAVYVGPQQPSMWAQAEGVARIIEDPAESKTAIDRLVAHAQRARMFVDRVPIVPVEITIHEVKLTDLTGGQPPVEVWTAQIG
jgi:nitroimidazol reductase NimA-like FMN-containing flavoprotein (pyridoxamine 5'-phosphate oxidase superfamily)